MVKKLQPEVVMLSASRGFELVTLGTYKCKNEKQKVFLFQVTHFVFSKS